MDISNTKILLKALVKLGKVGVKVFSDLKITLPEVFLIVGTLQQLSDLSKVHKDQILPELKDLSVEETAELLGLVIEGLRDDPLKVSQ